MASILAIFRPATAEEINWDEDVFGPRPFALASEAQLKNYYHERSIYEQYETINMQDTFINFANKQCFKIQDVKPTPEQQLEAEAFGTKLPSGMIRGFAKMDEDFSYISKSKIKFYKTGRYLIPAKFMWYRFDSGIGDEFEIDMPSDIFLTIPLYIASICLQIDNVQKAQLMRQEFELALARCTAGDFMTLNKLESLL